MSDYTELEINKFYNESCRMTMAKMPDNYCKYVITSPPYNIGGGKYDEFKDNILPYDFTITQIATVKELLRVTENHIFYITQIVQGNKDSIWELLHTFKLNVKDMVIHKKPLIPTLQGNFMNQCFEIVIIFSSLKPRSRIFSDANWPSGTLNNIIEVGKNDNPYKHLNSATFPTSLPRWFCINFGNPGDLIYDPYMSTGSTAIGCMMEERNWIGSELSAKQVEGANKRVKEQLAAQDLFSPNQLSIT